MVYARMAELLSDILLLDETEITPDFVLRGENGVGPIDIAKLAIAAEKAFGVELYDEKIARWRTLGDACRHMEGLLEAGEAEATRRSQADRTGWYYE